ncbi:Ribosome biogenesis GTPase A [Acholeplasma oculi]|uniref:Ribosome biogenesis GTPase A n=1 Tax=Acholeplasma oculi TaxID=35623 RepID=A0A061ABF0_9MOLU|nr:ribosome biogenesis GTPase YlqF [Acholeplasma oculi]CDR31173.1 GTP-binding protein, ribosome biogenesis YlqF [Acholeplasma oculi]SKC37728.1 ribosome biogenesis GTPase A [Acholeplasma oculi]SUT91042.1 Ribosome biogenesis GTPase A [Acholeplasma oculi]
MKQVQWFPGHMFKSLREIKEKIKLMDIVYLLVDARLPFSSMNPEILKIVGDKPTLLLFNKIDLSDRKTLDYWIKYYEDMGFYTLLINSNNGFNVDKIYSRSKEILKDKIERAQAKGMTFKVIRGMILGIPNVGKSTLINKMVSKKVANTANKPGVTKSQQWIKINPHFELLDTPGVLWPKFDDEKVGFALACTGAIKDDTLPINEVVLYLINYLKKFYPKRLMERYQLENIDALTEVEIMDLIAEKQGALLKGGFTDYDRVYQTLLKDTRNRMLGPLSFDHDQTTL